MSKNEELEALRAKNDAIFKAQDEEWKKKMYKNRKNKRNTKNIKNAKNNGNFEALFIGIPTGPALSLLLFFIFFYLLR